MVCLDVKLKLSNSKSNSRNSSNLSSSSTRANSNSCSNARFNELGGLQNGFAVNPAMLAWRRQTIMNGVGGAQVGVLHIFPESLADDRL